LCIDGGGGPQLQKEEANGAMGDDSRFYRSSSVGILMTPMATPKTTRQQNQNPSRPSIQAIGGIKRKREAATDMADFVVGRCPESVY
jgi:hypothetical protein